ncbi:MAG: amino acid--tRNA ligase-related protein, partial [Nanoarchaeota archaeon]
FIDEEDVFFLLEKLMQHVFKNVLDKELKIPFQRMTYKEALDKYKSDKPNLSKGRDDFKFLWITNFPLFKFSGEEGRIVSEHHPFTAPRESDTDKLEKDPLKVVSRSYDLVLNGYEIGSGSIRINNIDLQRKVFKVLKLTDKEIEEKFGFFLNAMRYGTPIHGGIALGLDRIIAIITGNNSIREVIAFPKNKDARDLMLDSPSEIKKEQLDELFLKLK